MTRTSSLVACLVLSACGWSFGHGSLPATSTATCTQNSDCLIPECPDACFGGQGACGGRTAYGNQEALDACPCLASPNEPWCAPPTDCEPPPCPEQAAGVSTAVAACVGGHCVAVLLDGGTAP